MKGPPEFWQGFSQPCLVAIALAFGFGSFAAAVPAPEPVRQRISINEEWLFKRGDPEGSASRLVYDLHAQESEKEKSPQPEVEPPPQSTVIKRWILPTGNAFLKDTARRFTRPNGNPVMDLAYAQSDFDDTSWRRLNLPHDWGIEGPFLKSGGGDTGRLPFYGVGWYRKKLWVPAADADKSVFLDVDGAMAYAAVWLNGQLVGGWPYGYASWRLDLTPLEHGARPARTQPPPSVLRSRTPATLRSEGASIPPGRWWRPG